MAPSTPSLSLLSACMGREANLLVSLPTWIKLNIQQIVIIDYNEEPTVRDFLKQNNIEDNRISVIHANVMRMPWTLSWAYNIGFRYCKSDFVLKLDADDCVKPDQMQSFIEYVLSCPEKSFLWAGDWRLENKIDEATSSGVFMADKASIYRCGGYNHCLLTYGWDDIDLYNRLCLHIGRDICLFPRGTTWKSAHSKLERFSNQLSAPSDKLSIIISEGLRDVSCTLNMALCRHLDALGFKLNELVESDDISEVRTLTIAMKCSVISALSSISFIDIVRQISPSEKKREIAKKVLKYSHYRQILKSVCHI